MSVKHSALASHLALLTRNAQGILTSSPGEFGAADWYWEPLTHREGRRDRVEYYFAEGSGRRAESASNIYQHNPINIICQNGPNGQISIANSEAIQIGHGNIITRHTASGEDGESPKRARGGDLGGGSADPLGGGRPENEDTRIKALLISLYSDAFYVTLKFNSIFIF